ncbi:hypothetical protein B0H10DRAFT_820603 [Mycena sp. CBHHK59/15]|nr:hypothetical protein B0H10DRAFT_820603 [Mycena sp. CBHHK59/15]
MLENTLRFINTVVKPKPVFTIPPSDPDPIHHFSNRNFPSDNNIISYASKTSVNSCTSPQKSTPSLIPRSTNTPKKHANNTKAYPLNREHATPSRSVNLALYPVCETCRLIMF